MFKEEDCFHYFIEEGGALAQGTCLAIGAHPDDLEIMAAPFIEDCCEHSNKKFVGVVCTHGVSAQLLHSGKSSEILKVKSKRRDEQLEAAHFAKYLGMIQLGYGSDDIKANNNIKLGSQLSDLILQVRPEIILTHNPFDRHRTHQAVCRHVLQAVLLSSYVPEKLLGCEVWGGLDWLESQYKVTVPLKSSRWFAQLISIFQSQNTENRNYAEGVLGRMRSNSTFHDSSKACEEQHIMYALDLLPLLKMKEENYLNFYLNN